MKKTSFLLVITSLIIFSSFFPIQTKAIGYSKDDISDYFNVDLTGYGLYSFGDFSQVGYKITPLAQLFFGIVQIEHEWINEPSLYIKGNKGYVHVWKENGTNVLYTVEKNDNYWRIVDIKRKKINRIPVSKKLLKEDFIVIMTHHFNRDQELLILLQNSPCRYLGILGSRYRTSRLFGEEDKPKWFFSPAGLSIGAEGPSEIAVSIMAEIIQMVRMKNDENNRDIFSSRKEQKNRSGDA